MAREEQARSTRSAMQRYARNGLNWTICSSENPGSTSGQGGCTVSPRHLRKPLLRYALYMMIVSLLLFLEVPRSIAEETPVTQEVLKVRLLAERSSQPKQLVQWDILELALQKSGRPFDLDVSALPTAPNRTARNMTMYGDEGNVMWGGVRPSREAEALVVHVPIFRGLFQYWRIWARKDELQRFADIKAIGDLAQFSVLQGPKWSTIPSFERHGITVVEGDFANMAEMLAQGRADLMPFSAIGTPSMFHGQIDELDVASLPDVLLVWPGDHFFMVDRNNQALHDALHEGLLRAFEDGSYVRLLRRHPDTRDAFRDVDLNAINLIYLESPYMTPAAQAALDKYSVNPADIFSAEAENQKW